MLEIGAIVWGVHDISRAVKFWNGCWHLAPQKKSGIILPEPTIRFCRIRTAIPFVWFSGHIKG